MMCILNEHRQIVAINTAMLDSLDMAHSDDVIGMRPGEAMRCVHRDDHPAGCGTGPFCRTCEAAIAIVASQSTSRPVERECVVSIMTRKGESRDLALSVRASPFELKGERFTVYCMTDIRVQKLFRELEHSFLHDISNLTTALCAACDLLRQSHSDQSDGVADDICDLTQRLAREITVQRLLISSDPSKYHLNWQRVEVAALLHFARRLAGTHPSAQHKRFAIESPPPVAEIATDATLLERVLANMLLNAFEATEPGNEVRLSIELLGPTVRFAVHNTGCMPPTTAARVFHRHFTTKQGLGRGQGTFAIRLLGESLLQGKASFSTDVQLGTDFFLELPLKPDQNRRSLAPKPR
jgi:signal transduction histidine kinase